MHRKEHQLKVFGNRRVSHCGAVVAIDDHIPMVADRVPTLIMPSEEATVPCEGAGDLLHELIECTVYEVGS